MIKIIGSNDRLGQQLINNKVLLENNKIKSDSKLKSYFFSTQAVPDKKAYTLILSLPACDVGTYRRAIHSFCFFSAQHIQLLTNSPVN